MSFDTFLIFFWARAWLPPRVSRLLPWRRSPRRVVRPLADCFEVAAIWSKTCGRLWLMEDNKWCSGFAVLRRVPFWKMHQPKLTHWTSALWLPVCQCSRAVLESLVTSGQRVLISKLTLAAHGLKLFAISPSQLGLCPYGHVSPKICRVARTEVGKMRYF